MTFEELVIELQRDLPENPTTEVKYVGDNMVLETTLLTKDVMGAIMVKLPTLPPTDVKEVLETAGDFHKDNPELLAFCITHSSALVREVSCDLAGYYATKLWMCQLLSTIRALVYTPREYTKLIAGITGIRAGESYLKTISEVIAAGVADDISKLIGSGAVVARDVITIMIQRCHSREDIVYLAVRHCGIDELAALVAVAAAAGRNKLAKKLRYISLQTRLDILSEPATPTRKGTIDVVYGESAALTKHLKWWLQLIETQVENNGK